VRQRPDGSTGFALAELLVVLALAGLVLLALTGLLQQGGQAYLGGTARLDAQQSARVALERLGRELRGAGIQNDLNGDGVISGNPERITYALRGRALRRNAGGGAQPIIDDVEALTFAYLDAEGRPTRVPGEIRSVLIAVTTGPQKPGTGAVTMTTQVRFRNR